MRQSVKFVNAALSEEGGDIVLRGVVDPESLEMLKAGSYQREEIRGDNQVKLVEALTGGAKFPAIELASRGADYRDGGSGTFYIPGDVWLVDGLQRKSAAVAFMAARPDADKPMIGATLYFNTTEEWERERFKTVNKDRLRVSPSILLRNLRETHQVIDILMRLTEDKKSPLYGRISWSQRMAKGNLLTALDLIKALGHLHAHIGPARSSAWEDAANGLEKIVTAIGKNAFRENVLAFVELLDATWGFRHVTIREGAYHLKGGFMRALAAVLSQHRDFWKDDDGHHLFVKADLQRKIASFAVRTDPVIQAQCGGSGKAQSLLTQWLIEHINSGKRQWRLKSRMAVPTFTVMPDTNGDSDNEVSQ